MQWIVGYFCRKHWVLKLFHFSGNNFTGIYAELVIMSCSNSDDIVNRDKSMRKMMNIFILHLYIVHCIFIYKLIVMFIVATRNNANIIILHIGLVQTQRC